MNVVLPSDFSTKTKGRETERDVVHLLFSFDFVVKPIIVNAVKVERTPTNKQTSLQGYTSIHVRKQTNKQRETMWTMNYFSLLVMVLLVNNTVLADTKVVNLLALMEYGFDESKVIIREPSVQEYDGVLDKTKDFYKNILSDEFNSNAKYQFQDLTLDFTAASYDPSALERPLSLDFSLFLIFDKISDPSSDDESLEEQVLDVLQSADYQNDFIPNYVQDSEPQGSIFEGADVVLFSSMVVYDNIVYIWNAQIDFRFDPDAVVFLPTQSEINENTRITSLFYQRKLQDFMPTKFDGSLTFDETITLIDITGTKYFPFRSYYTVRLTSRPAENFPSIDEVFAFMESVPSDDYVEFSLANQDFSEFGEESTFSKVIEIKFGPETEFNDPAPIDDFVPVDDYYDDFVPIFDDYYDDFVPIFDDPIFDDPIFVDDDA